MARTARQPTGQPVKTLSEVFVADDNRDPLPEAGSQLQRSVPDIPLEETDELAALESFLAQIDESATSATVHVSILQPGNKEARCWKGSPEDFDLERIAEDFGSGDYVVKVFTPSERGNPALRIRKVIRQLISPAKERDLKKRRDAEAVATAAPGSQDIEAIITRVVSALAPRQPDPMSQLQALAGVMKTMMPNPQPTPSSDPVLMFTTMAKLFKDMNADRAPIEGGANATLGDLALKYGGTILELLQKGGNPNAVPIPPAALPAPGAAAAAEPLAPAAPTTPEEEIMFQQMLLKKGISFLVDQAKENADPTLYAELTIDQVPPQALDEFLAAPDFIATLAQFVPAVTQFRPWFEQLKAAIIEQRKEDAAEGKAP